MVAGRAKCARCQRFIAEASLWRALGLSPDSGYPRCGAPTKTTSAPCRRWLDTCPHHHH